MFKNVSNRTVFIYTLLKASITKDPALSESLVFSSIGEKNTYKVKDPLPFNHLIQKTHLLV